MFAYHRVGINTEKKKALEYVGENTFVGYTGALDYPVSLYGDFWVFAAVAENASASVISSSTPHTLLRSGAINGSNSATVAWGYREAMSAYLSSGESDQALCLAVFRNVTSVVSYTEEFIPTQSAVQTQPGDIVVHFIFSDGTDNSGSVVCLADYPLGVIANSTDTFLGVGYEQAQGATSIAQAWSGVYDANLTKTAKMVLR